MNTTEKRMLHCFPRQKSGFLSFSSSKWAKRKGGVLFFAIFANFTHQSCARPAEFWDLHVKMLESINLLSAAVSSLLFPKQVS